MKPLSGKDVFRYLKLEEDDDTVELLLPASLRDLGAHDTPSGLSHFWSYPTPDGVAWVELTPDGRLGMVDNVPPSVLAATPPRADHPMRSVTRPECAPPVAKRLKPERAVWVPLAELPACHLYPAWVEPLSFDAALTHFGAKATRDNSAGPGRLFYLQLTSGRYACLETRRHTPESVTISLEVDTRRAGKNCGGRVHVCDVEEILRPMNARFTMPTANLFIAWTTDP